MMHVPDFLWEEDVVDSRLRCFVSAQVEEASATDVPFNTLMQLFGEDAKSYAMNFLTIENFTAEEWFALTRQMSARISLRAIDPAFMAVRARTVGGNTYGIYAQEKQNELKQHFGDCYSEYQLQKTASVMEGFHYATAYLFQNPPEPGKEVFYEKSQTVARYYMWMLSMFVTLGRIPNEFFLAERHDELNLSKLFRQAKERLQENKSHAGLSGKVNG